MELRKAQLGDASAIAKLEALSFPVSEAASLASIQARIRVFGNHFWLLFSDTGKLLAFANGMVTDCPNLEDRMYEQADLHQETGAWQMIFSLVTHPDYRKQGLAQQCLQAAIEDARVQKRQGVVLTCKDHLISYYENFGMVNEGFAGSTHGDVNWNQMRLKF